MQIPEETSVCGSCFGDQALRDFIKERATAKVCSYCGKRSSRKSAAKLEIVTDYMRDCFLQEYDEAVNCLPYESAEGGYLGEHWDTWDFLEEQIKLELPGDSDNKLLTDLVHGIGTTSWCHKDPFSLTPLEVKRLAWELFCDRIKHERRFFFLDDSKKPKKSKEVFFEPKAYTPKEILKLIFAHSVTAELFTTLPANTKLFRAREQKEGANLTTAQDLGPPPREKATQSNRMSPPGIVMFYASNNRETALRETALGPGQFVIGKFSTKRKALILDLTKLPPIPSLFEQVSDSLEFEPREVQQFLHYVTREMSKPIARDDRVHIEYVPTQVVTEFIRTQCKHNKRKIDGIRYPSAVHRGGNSIVLFANQANILPAPRNSYRVFEDRWLELKGRSNFEVTTTILKSWKNGMYVP